MISYDEALAADEFHISHAGLPCTVWQRAGGTIPGAGPGSFFVPVERDGEDGRRAWHHITGVNAADFHTPGTCPRRVRENRPPGSRTAPLPGLDDGYDEDGFDADGYDRADYDADGYNRAGDNADGWNRDTTAGDLDLDGLWRAFTRCRSRYDPATQDAFREHLRAMLPGCPDDADDLAFCGNCDRPAWDEALESVQGGDLRICPSCWDDWVTCGNCEEKYPPGEMAETLGGSDICDGCRCSYYSYCEDCGGYYNDNDADEHEHDESRSGCCESPQLAFMIRNDGCEPLENDTRVTVTLPSGVISAEGIQAIRSYLYSHDLYLYAEDRDALGDRWQTRAGNFAKRLSRHAYSKCGMKLSPEVLSQVGCIARDHSNAVSTAIEVTRDLNLGSGDFANDGSCWWGSYSESRCALKTNGGFGLRSFNDGDAYPSGRAWVMPLRKARLGRLAPTFETMTPDAFVVFNGYGDLSGYTAARVMAHMAGWTYRKIGFSCEPMYVNAGGYLIAAEDLAKQYTDGSLCLDVRQHSDLFRTEQAARKELVHA